MPAPTPYVSALYVDARGPYPALVEDWWDRARNADHYTWSGRGNPVVAHPPCAPYSKIKHLAGVELAKATSHARYAVGFVRRFGGVLEHPAGSELFDEERTGLGLPKPGDSPDYAGGFTVEVCRVEWGHVARKRTWLYFCGIQREHVDAAIAQPPFPGRQPTHWVSGGRDPKRRYPGDVVPPGIKVCSAEQRRRTPPLFAAMLVELASHALGVEDRS